MSSQVPRIAVIGAGNWGKNHVRVFNDAKALAAVAETDASTRERIAAAYPHVRIYSNYRDLLAEPLVDGVVIATPAPTHFGIAREALAAGKDVLVEKPMSLSVGEAEKLVKTANTLGRVFMVGHLLLYKPAVKKIKEILDSKAIGQIYMIEMRRLKLGTVRRSENVLWSFSPHDLAMLSYLVDSPVEDLSAYGTAALQRGIEDDIRLNILFRNGIQALVHAAWLWPEDERKTVIVGSRGMITYDENVNRLAIHRKEVTGDLSIRDQGVEVIEVEPADALQNEALHFIQSVAGRSEPLTGGESGIEVINMLVKAEQDLKKKRSADYFAHETACIDQGARIGKGSQIWHFTHVMPGAVIGEHCKLGQNVFIGQNVTIGDNVKIQNNVSVYEGVILEEDVFCGPSAVFTNIRTPRSAFPRNNSDDYLPTLIKRGASIGANATVLCGITVGESALIGAGAVVTKDVPPFAVVYGNPSEIKGWVCRCGASLVDAGAKQLQCTVCHTKIQVK